MSYGQIPDCPQGYKCYNQEELRAIAERTIRANECDTLLATTELELIKADSIIIVQRFEIVEGKRIISNYEIIHENEAADIEELKGIIAKDDNKKRWLKIGWVSTALAELALIFYLMLN